MLGKNKLESGGWQRTTITIGTGVGVGVGDGGRAGSNDEKVKGIVIYNGWVGD